MPAPRPGAQAGTDDWAGRRIALHEHTAEAAGVACPMCGFPWWPDAPRLPDSARPSTDCNWPGP